MPLSMVGPGQKVRLISVTAGRNVRNRLAAMGLVPGTELEVISRGRGPVIISVNSNRLILGYGMASKIEVA
ncbi:MAG: ferrous iron transport protein A [candidate division Zixibacteria bacterium]|nr:ferrous iron transport protein A [candidate division Zixibacteria bacterium]